MDDRLEKDFYHQFQSFQADFAKIPELLERQNEILTGIYLRLSPKPQDPPQPESPAPVTGIAQIDAALAKQKEKLP